MPMTISELLIYPVKSCAPVRMKSSVITPRGLAFDRLFMIVDENSQFVSQRSHPPLALIKPTLEYTADQNIVTSLTLDAPSMPRVMLELSELEPSTKKVNVWQHTCAGHFAPHRISDWLSDFLGFRAHLVYQSKEDPRPIDLDYAQLHDQTSFADAFPILLTSETSLDRFNQQLSEPIRMDRFRPNIVVSGGDAFAEDTWLDVEINGYRFSSAKPCKRCKVITTDQAQGKVISPEPLKELAKTRLWDKGAIFGQNLIPYSSPHTAGDAVLTRVSIDDTIDPIRFLPKPLLELSKAAHIQALKSDS